MDDPADRVTPSFTKTSAPDRALFSWFFVEIPEWMRITNCTIYVNATMTAHDTTPRVYVACLASYVAGRLHGEWVDATDEDEIQDCIERVLKSSPVPGAEEHAFHDYDNFPANMGEYDSVERVAAIGALIEEHGHALVAGVYGHCSDLDELEEALTDRYRGEYEDLGDYAYQMNEDHGVPEHLAMYLDWDAMGRDWQLSGDIFTVEIGTKVHVFSNR